MMKTPFPHSKNGKKAIKQAKKVEKNGLKKPIRKIDKNRVYAWVLLVLMVFWTFASVVSLVHTFGGKSSMSSISAGAEGVDYNEMTIDPFQYPTANLLNWPYDTSAIFEGGVTWQVNEDGTLTINGSTATLVSEFYINRQNVYFYPGATYSFSFTIFDGQLQNNTISLSLLVKKLDGTRQRLGTVFNQNSSTFVVPVDTEFIEIALFVQPNKTVNNVTFGIMYNQGSTAYPYQPPYQLVYENGFEQGAQNSYDNGYNEGLLFSQYGPFYDANIIVKEWQSEPDGGPFQGIVEEYSPSYVNMGLDFSSIAQNLGTAFCYNLIIEFRQPITPMQAEQLVIYANSAFSYDYGGEVMLAKVYYDGTRFNQYRLVYSDSFGGAVLDLPMDFSEPITSLEFSKIKNEIAFENLIVAIGDSLFLNGFESGYKSGENSPDVLERIASAKAEGVAAGRLIGYDQGLQDASDYSFFSLLSAVVDAPLAMFKDMFNFDILGINLSNFALGLLTLAMVLGVVKLIL